MSTIDMSRESSNRSPDTGTVEFKLEVVVVPVSDADRAKQFYASLGWREDADFVISEDYRVLQFTPPGSQASIIFGTGITAAVPGSIDSLLLAVYGIDAAREQLRRARRQGLRGVPRRGRWPRRRLPRRHRRARRGTGSRGPLLRLVCVVQRPGRQRLAAAGDHRATPGPGVSDGRCHPSPAPARDGRAPRRLREGRPAVRLVGLVRPYLSAREQGSTSEQASVAADRYMREVRGVVVSR